MSETMVRCSQCGAQVETTARFCVECGNAMPGGAPMAAAPQTSRAPKVAAGTLSKKTLSGNPDVPKSQAAPVSKRATQTTPSGVPPPPARWTAVDGPSSKTPAARAAMSAAGAVPSAEQVPVEDRPPISEMLSALDGGFEAMIAGAKVDPAAASNGDAARLFREIAALHVRPVRDFMIEVRLGEPPKEWIDVCTPAIVSLRSSAEQLGLRELVAALDEFGAALKLADDADGTVVAGATRELLNEAFGKLATELPEAFDLTAEADRREPLIVQSLLRQIPEVRKVALGKLVAGGLVRLEMFFVARPDELATVTGLDAAVAGKIVERFQRYKREVAAVAPDPTRSPERALLGELTVTLSQQHQAYESGVDKRRARREREETLLSIKIVLARLGEITLVDQLERLPFQRKIEVLEAHLATDFAKS